MKTLDLEQMLLPQQLPVNISRLKAAVRFFLAVCYIILFIFSMIAGCYALDSSNQQPIALGVVLVAFSSTGLWAFALVFLQSLNNLRNAGTPPLVLTDRSLQLKSFSIPWIDIKALTLRVVSNGRASFAYVHLDVANATLFPTNDMTETVLPYLFKQHKKRLKLPADATLVPLEQFDKSPGDLMILLKRYWSKATGRSYQPQSVELLYPQKKFSDFSQKH